MKMTSTDKKSKDYNINKSGQIEYKEFAGQFSCKQKKEMKKPKEVHFSINSNENNLNQTHLIKNSISDSCDINTKRKSERKQKLKRRIKRLRKENTILSQKLQANDDFYNKKISESRELLQSINKYNEDLGKENKLLKLECANFAACQKELEMVRHKCYSMKNTLEKTTTELEYYKQRNSELENDLQMLKTIVYRLNLHLERYQEKLKTLTSPKEEQPVKPLITHNGILQTKEHEDHQHVPITWGKVNVHTLGPLLDAYQETVLEKESVIEEYENAMANFTLEFKKIIEENELLHSKLTEDESCSIKLTAQMEKLTRDLELSKDQNNLLSKKCALKQKKMDEVLEIYQQKVHQMKTDHATLLEEYQKCKIEINSLKERNKILPELQEEIKKQRENLIPTSIHEARVNECKRWYEELKAQYEAEKRKLSENATILSDEVDNLKKQIESLNSEKTIFQKKLQQEEVTVQKLKKRCENFKRILHSLHIQKRGFKRHLRKTMNFARDLVDEQESLLKALYGRNLRAEMKRKFVKKVTLETHN